MEGEGFEWACVILIGCLILVAIFFGVGVQIQSRWEFGKKEKKK